MELNIKFAGDIPLTKAMGDSPPKPKAKEEITYLSELILAASLCETKRSKAAGINSRKLLTHPEVSGFVSYALINRRCGNG